MKKIYFLLFCFLLSFLINQNLVQASTSTAPIKAPTFDPTKVAVNSIPQATVYDVVVDKKSYNQGDVVSGTFFIKNTGAVNITDLNYSVILGGEYRADGIPLKEYGEDRKSDKIFLEIGGVKKISFTYNLPKNVSGENLGVSITLYSSGRIMSWNSAKFNISKSQNSLWIETVGAWINTSGKAVNINIGPFVKEGDTLEVKYMSGSYPDNFSVTPSIKIYNFTNLTTSIKEYKLDPVVLNSKSTFKTKLDLMNKKPGVYVGNLTLLDSNNNPVSVDLSFRYIVPGDISTITSVVSDKQTVQKGDPMNVAVNYMGLPIDPLNLNKAEIKNLELSLRVSNESGGTVFSGKEIVSTNLASKNFSFTALENANKITVKAVLKTEDGKTLSEYETSLTNPENKDINVNKNNFLVWKIVGIILLILIIVVLIFLRKKISNKNIGIIAVFIFMFAGGLGLVNLSKASFSLDTTYYNNSYYYLKPKGESSSAKQVLFTPNEVGGDGILSPGEVHYVTGSVSVDGCYNAPSSMVLDLYNETSSLGRKEFMPPNDSRFNINNHNAGRIINSSFSFGPYTASNTVGNKLYYLWGYFNQESPFHHQESWYGGWLTYKIVSNTPTATSTTPTSGGSGGGAGGNGGNNSQYCGSAISTVSLTKPINNLCSSDVADTDMSGSGSVWSWKCSTSNCNALKCSTDYTYSSVMNECKFNNANSVIVPKNFALLIRKTTEQDFGSSTSLTVASGTKITLGFKTQGYSSCTATSLPTHASWNGNIATTTSAELSTKDNIVITTSQHFILSCDGEEKTVKAIVRTDSEV